MSAPSPSRAGERPADRRGLEERLLIVAPTGRDAPLTASLLEQASIVSQVCPDVRRLCEEIGRGAAAALVAEEVLTPTSVQALLALLQEQEAWSDLPIILFTGASAGEAAIRPQTGQLLRALGNVTLLDRPLRPITMLSAARAALRARRRQYQARDELVRQQNAVLQRDQFLAMLSHELRNPLGAIVLAADTLLERRGDPTRRMEIIRRQGQNLSRLVDELLDVTRVTTGKVALREERLELNELTERVLRSFEPVAQSATVQLALRRSGEALEVSGDAVRLDQVLGNLVTNAIKYTPAGGHVEVRLEREGEAARLAVRDDGVGIAPEVLPRVFDLFTQADNSLDRSRGGLGIGLTVVRTLVELHRGRIEARSDGLGRGSEFLLRLPLAPPRERIEPAEEPAPAAAPRHHRVLVVEDNADARELVQMVLEADGHEVMVAGDGLEGVRRALESRPTLALVDIGLPGLNGFEVARRIRDALGDEVVLIALSGYGMAEDRRLAAEAGFDLHFMKPVDCARLQQVLNVDPDELGRRRRSGRLAG